MEDSRESQPNCVFFGRDLPIQRHLSKRNLLSCFMISMVCLGIQFYDQLTSLKFLSIYDTDEIEIKTSTSLNTTSTTSSPLTAPTSVSSTSLNTPTNLPSNKPSMGPSSYPPPPQFPNISPIKYDIPNGDYKAPYTPGAFIHIGKSGGSTVSFLLRNGCHSWVQKPCKDTSNYHPESYASFLSTYYHTPDFGYTGFLEKYSKEWKYDFYLISVRDPYDRAASAFSVAHPSNILALQFYEKKLDKRMSLDEYIDSKRDGGWEKNRWDSFSCFPTYEEFAMLVGKDHDNYTLSEEEASTHKTTDTTTCSTKAKGIIHGDFVNGDHLYWNYKNILSLMNGWDKEDNVANVSSGTKESLADKDKEDNETNILLIRNEYKWQDWIAVNEWLGQEKGTVEIYPEMHNRNSADHEMPVTREVSDEGRLFLCLALAEEYVLYFKLMQLAVNVNVTNIDVSYQKARESCPILFDDNDGSFLFQI